jgi:hypothetical protein
MIAPLAMTKLNCRSGIEPREDRATRGEAGAARADESEREMLAVARGAVKQVFYLI